MHVTYLSIFCMVHITAQMASCQMFIFSMTLQLRSRRAGCGRGTSCSEIQLDNINYPPTDMKYNSDNRQVQSYYM